MCLRPRLSEDVITYNQRPTPLQSTLTTKAAEKGDLRDRLTTPNHNGTDRSRSETTAGERDDYQRGKRQIMLVYEMGIGIPRAAGNIQLFRTCPRCYQADRSAEILYNYQGVQNHRTQTVKPDLARPPAIRALTWAILGCILDFLFGQISAPATRSFSFRRLLSCVYLPSGSVYPYASESSDHYMFDRPWTKIG